MSPELIDPDRFGFKDSRPTKESDCYALGMVVLEVLTGQPPFSRYIGLTVMRKIVDGERPERPRGAEAVWFTDDLWETLGQCWSPQPEVRPAVEVVLERLDRGSTTWQPLPPSTDDVQTDSDISALTVSYHPRMLLHSVLNLELTCRRPLLRVRQSCKVVTNPQFDHEGILILWMRTEAHSNRPRASNSD